ncbi:MAG TPA: dihydrofolate reductase family protein [Streptosporangiaceae bacterium]|nr:dihydrofolate reductase family protein [Streptosporangiaceae bacterium]
MPQRPYVLLSAAVSADGYIDDATPDRLVLSDAHDLDRVDEVRAGVDAILVGAGTIRADNPRLLVRSAARRAARAAAGRPASPARVTLTSRGGLDPAARFFTAEAGTVVEAASRLGDAAGPGRAGGTGGADGAGQRIVYAAGPVAGRVRTELAGTGAEVVGLDQAGLASVLADLGARGVERLLVEGGAGVLTGFLTAGLADELQLMVAPFFVGGGVRMTQAGAYPHGPGNPMRLADVGRLGDAVLLRYLLTGSAR